MSATSPSTACGPRPRRPASGRRLRGTCSQGEAPTAPTRLAVGLVNRLIGNCADGEHVFYADLGAVLLDEYDRLTDAVSRRDRLHLTTLGYERLAERLGPLLDRLLGDRK